MQRLVVLAFLVLSACGPGSPGGPTMNNRINPRPVVPTSRVVTQDILHREPTTSRSKVKHILISWAAKADAYPRGGIDPRAAERTQPDAEAMVDDILARIADGTEFDDLMMMNSEDSGLARNPDGYEVRPDAELVLEFRQLGLRLELDEVGVVETDFGFHVMKRVE